MIIAYTHRGEIVKKALLAVVAALAIGLAVIPASASAAPESQRGHHGHHQGGWGHRGNTVVVEQVPVAYPVAYPVYPAYTATYATYAPTYAIVYCPSLGYYQYAAYCP
jgi:hypothetical protein